MIINLESLSRSELQAKFKALGLTGANRKSADLITDIEEALSKGATEHELQSQTLDIKQKGRAEQVEIVVFEPAAHKVEELEIINGQNSVSAVPEPVVDNKEEVIVMKKCELKALVKEMVKLEIGIYFT